MDALCQRLKSVLCSVQARYQPKTFIVGLSGGVDSVVLLHALVSLRQHAGDDNTALQAVYVNHGLSANALHWQTHCEDYCKRLDVPFCACSVNVNTGPRESVEAVARMARYDALLELAQQSSGVVLTAHHQDDQLETVMLQLKRGAGPKGLSGMADISEMNDIAIVRPLLDISRQQIEAYAHHYDLSWIEDESNTDERYDRNFLRRSILPALTRRWPALAQTVSRSAQLCAEQQSLLDEVCDERLNGMTSASSDRISVSALKQVSPRWQRALLRRWLTRHNTQMPSAQQLEQVIGMLYAKIDSQPLVTLKDDEIRRFRDELFYVVTASRAFSLAPQSMETDTDVHLSSLGITLRLSLNVDQAVSEMTEFSKSGTSVTLLSQLNHRIETPSLSTKVKPLGQSHHKPLKQWLKDWQIPPWERGKVLMLLSSNEPVALINDDSVIALDNNGQVHAELIVRLNRPGHGKSLPV